MLRKSESNGIGTSFRGVTINATANQLTEIVGECSELKSGDGKTTLQWILENEDNQVITIYDWKMYREVGLDEEIEWNIGGHNKQSTEKAKEEILNLLNK
jgi:hypothetical protein